MNLARTIYIILTYPQRIRHRLGFGVQSPNDYELVRDVLFERLSYYAYDDLHLTRESERQLWRLKNHFDSRLIVITNDSTDEYECLATSATDDTWLLIEHLNGQNAHLWPMVLRDPRATVTFDLGDRGLISFNSKRIKQNYIL